MGSKAARSKKAVVNWRNVAMMFLAIPLGCFLLVMLGMRPAANELTHIAGGTRGPAFSDAVVLRLALMAAAFGAIGVLSLVLNTLTY
jgi:hypothetical protein